MICPAFFIPAPLPDANYANHPKLDWRKRLKCSAKKTHLPAREKSSFANFASARGTFFQFVPPPLRAKFFA
jgi:hypothetical protein